MGQNKIKSIIAVWVTMTACISGSKCGARDTRSRTQTGKNYYIQQLNVLSNSNRLLRQDYSTLAQRFVDLEQQLKQLKANNIKLSSQIVQLKTMLEQEAKNRDAAMRELAKNIARQIATAINLAQVKQQASSTAKLPVGNGKFYQYTVQRGATLSAIAKAYKVKVADIRRANRLKNDNIRAGQLLYIPRH